VTLCLCDRDVRCTKYDVLIMKLSDFDYHLPKELIAQYPLEKRDAARLLVVNRQSGDIEHRIFKDVGGYLHKDDLLVLNNTKVLTCRLIGRRSSGGRVEVLLLHKKEELTFDALIKPARVKLGERIFFNGEKIYALRSSKNEVTFQAPSVQAVYALGEMPLPPYIKREPRDLDNIYYQTVYACQEGAVAAPTAGLHFTDVLLEDITRQGIKTAYVTLHVGYGTFMPVKIEDITQHKMEREHFRIPEETVGHIETARQQKKRILAVGTTSLRVLETYASEVREGYTDLFIYPGYKFKIVQGLLTNFHLPKTTLFMLVCAFAGTRLMQEAYRRAIEKKYRFYSYGDCMLIV
jgi:S-adenosylmethionine:tRNA ribosyltransferase-isomerase